MNSSREMTSGSERGVLSICYYFSNTKSASSVKRIVELDGSQHYEHQGMEYDAERTVYLELRGGFFYVSAAARGSLKSVKIADAGNWWYNNIHKKEGISPEDFEKNEQCFFVYNP